MRLPLTLLKICLILLFAVPVMSQNSLSPWNMADVPGLEFKAKADTWARNYQAYHLSLINLKNMLAEVPYESTVSLKKSPFIFSLPMPDGSFSRFRLVESPVMEKGLADAFPEIKTYAGQGIDDVTATLRCDLTQWGFHAMMISANGTVFVDPPNRFITDEYISYYKKDALRQDFAQECLNTDEHNDNEVNHTDYAEKLDISGSLRTYRLALACTGEYAAYHGGTIPGVLAAMVTSMNRVNGVYERELGIHMNIVANDTLLIYLNSNSDPYSNNNGGTMLSQNQTTCTNIIGSANYDIGHVFSTGGGGIAQLGCICNNSKKAMGVTGLDTPIGDAFDIDYVAHEMGHQFGANHTFNSTAGSCGGGNRVSSAAYEPGSASTIMGYAGICGNQDLQLHSDDYFHAKSFDEIVTYTQNGGGNSCAVTTTDGNNPPVLTVQGDFNIPLNTPFRMTASATDVDGDSLTYCWEEYDLGPAGNWNSPSANAPIFRSFNPTTSGTRVFPKLANILNNNTTIGEIKPSYSRTLNFRCTVRDNVLDGAGVVYNPMTSKVIVAATPGPFAILTPNTTGITWASYSTQTVTWSVNGSDQAPVNTPNVNVLLSLDGGYTFPITLGAGVPNNGSYSFVVPANQTTTARIMVEGAGNIFFDINDKNFSINGSVGIEQNNLSQFISLYPNPTVNNTNLAIINNDRGNIVILVTDATGKVISSYSTTKNDQQFTYTLQTENLAVGIYFVRVKSESGMAMKRIVKN
ncbi:MAG: M12 family metallo-peptidase [Bacteroidetes bacterium]|nr:M12 family metallo-peptidase [Bacteroidota bacterium]